MKYIVIPLMFIVIIGIIVIYQKPYDITYEYLYIKSFYNQSSRIIVEKINVDSVASKNINSKMYEDSLGRIHTRPEIKKGFPIVYNIDSSYLFKNINEKSTLPNKIYFHKINNGFYWQLWEPHPKITRNNILPFEFKIGDWFRIRNLKSQWGGHNYKIYFKIEHDSSIISFHKTAPRPF